MTCDQSLRGGQFNGWSVFISYISLRIALIYRDKHDEKRSSRLVLFFFYSGFDLLSFLAETFGVKGRFG